MFPSNPDFLYMFRVPPENQDNEMPVSVVEEETEEEIQDQGEYNVEIFSRVLRTVSVSRDPTSTLLPIPMASFLKSDVLPLYMDAAIWVLRQMISPGLQGIAGGWPSVSYA